MNRIEQLPAYQPEAFSLEAFDFGDDGFDINAAFQEAMQGIATDTELAIEEKVRRMETIVSEGTSDVYRSFVDFRAMAAQMEMMCNHDHALHQAFAGSELLSQLRDNHGPEDGHDHTRHTHDKHDDDKEKSKSTKKKKKSKKSWFTILMTSE